jgi:hypothetical protein
MEYGKTLEDFGMKTATSAADCLYAGQVLRLLMSVNNGWTECTNAFANSSTGAEGAFSSIGWSSRVGKAYMAPLRDERRWANSFGVWYSAFDLTSAATNRNRCDANTT